MKIARHNALRIPSYPHFDEKLCHRAARLLISSQESVASHAFHPLLKRKKEYVKFRKGKRPADGWPRKTREIFYAAKRDAVIFRHYRALLFDKYEKLLVAEGIDEAVLAYRQVPEGHGRNKSNLEFARDAFSRIHSAEDCYVFCLDIEKFFENLDHRLLRRSWKKLLNLSRLPKDHAAVLKAATQYTWVSERLAFRRLGFFGEKLSSSGKLIEGYLKPRKDLPTPLCSALQFRRDIAPLVSTNTSGKGVAQGLPISDVLANVSLLIFDKAISQFAKSSDGFFCRYSDDILLVVPADGVNVNQVVSLVQKTLSECGAGLRLKASKTAVFRVQKRQDGFSNVDRVVPSGKSGPIDYLGLCYDGRSITLRSATLARLNRRIVHRIRREATSLVSKNPDVTITELRGLFKVQGVMRSFGRVDLETRQKAKSEGTGGFRGNFRSYAVRATSALSDKSGRILGQLASQKAFIRKRVEQELQLAVKRAKH